MYIYIIKMSREVDILTRKLREAQAKEDARIRLAVARKEIAEANSMSNVSFISKYKLPFFVVFILALFIVVLLYVFYAGNDVPEGSVGSGGGGYEESDVDCPDTQYSRRDSNNKAMCPDDDRCLNRYVTTDDDLRGQETRLCERDPNNSEKCVVGKLCRLK